MTTATATREAPAATRLAVPAAAVVSRAAGWLLCLLPGLLTIYLAFNSGGHGPEVRALALLLLSLLLMARIALMRQPFAGVSRPLMVAGGALLLFGVWTWLSSAWSGAPIRAATEFQLVALYAIGLIFFGAFLRRRGGLALMLRGIALAIAAVCLVALATRLYPDTYPVEAALSPSRLAHPISYWNGLGLLAAVGLVLMLHLACDERGSIVMRMLGAAGVPLAATTIFFTFSRGATAAAVLGVLAYLVIGRPRGAIAGLIATAPTTYFVVQAAYDANLLGTEENTTAAAAAQGHDVAAVLLMGCAAAALCRLALGPVDAKLKLLHLASATRARTAPVAIGLVAVAVALGVAMDAPGRVERAWTSFTNPEQTEDTSARTRFREANLTGREQHWDVAMDFYRQDRLKGAGAGTFETQWLRRRPNIGAVTDAHSLYYEVLSELGLVGFLLLACALCTIVVGLAVRARGKRRPIYAAVLAVSLMWMAHAGVDWDWELPAVSLWFFALAGTALARPVRPDSGDVTGRSMGWPLRAGAGLVCLLVASGAVRTIISSNALDDAITGFRDGNCVVARDFARTSLATLSTQPQAVAVLGYCASREGRHTEAVRTMSTAADLDPDHWRYRYGLAIVRARAGRDPRPDLMLARKLNPHGELAATGAATELARSAPSRWRRVAAEAEQKVD